MVEGLGPPLHCGDMGSNPLHATNSMLYTKMKELTNWEKEYIDKHLPSKTKSDFYYDNPGSAIEDIEFLLEVIKKLRS